MADLKINSYNDKIDPEDHVNLYLNILKPQTIDNRFPDMFKSNPYRLFSNQPARSVTNFADLSLRFITQYVSMIRIKHGTIDSKEGK